MDEKWVSDEEWEAKKEAKADSSSAYLEKVRKISKEEARLKRQFAKIDKNKKALVQTTISDIAYMTIEMQYLRDSIIREGTQVEYKNGENQYGTKQNPDAQLYLQMSQKQTAAMKILIDCLPKTEKTVEKSDGFEEFIADRDD